MGTGCLTHLTHKNGVYKKKSKFKGSDMRTREEEREIVKRALALLHGSPKPEQQDRQIGEPEAGTAETLAASVLAENKPDEVAQILAIWRDLGIKDLDGQRVRQGCNPQERKPVGEHLADLRSWQNKRRSRDGA